MAWLGKNGRGIFSARWRARVAHLLIGAFIFSEAAPIYANDGPAVASNSASSASSDVRPTTAKDLYDFLWRELPSYGAPQKFFEKLRQNPDWRAQYNRLIESDPRLSKIAEQGRKFRDAFLSQFDQDFPSPGAERLIAAYPYQYIYQSFERFRRSQLHKEELPIPEALAESYAVHDTLNGHGEALGKTFTDVRQEQNYAWYHYRRRRPRFLDQTEIRRGHAEPGQAAVDDWKRSTVQEIDRVREENFRLLLQHLSAKNDFLLIFTPDQTKTKTRFRDKLKFWRWFQGRSVDIWVRELDKSQVRLLTPYTDYPDWNYGREGKLSVSFWNRVGAELVPATQSMSLVAVTLATLFPWLIFSRSKLISNTPLDVLRMQRIERRELVNWLLTHSERPGEFISAKVIDPQTKRESRIRVPLTSFLWQLANYYNRFHSFDDPEERYLQEIALREGMLAKTRDWLLNEPSKTLKGLGEKIFSELSTTSKRVEVDTDILRLQIARPFTDAVSDLEWAGYAKAPDHWTTRDQITSTFSDYAIESGTIPTSYLNPKSERKKNRNDSYSKSKWLNNVVSFALVNVLVIAGLLKSHKLLPKIDGSAQDPNGQVAGPGAPQDYTPLSGFASAIPATDASTFGESQLRNYSEDELKEQAKEVKFTVIPLQDQRPGDLPHYFDLPSEADPKSNWKPYKTNEVVGESEFKVVPASRNFPDSHRRIPVYRPDGYVLKRLHMTNSHGRELTEGLDYRILQNSVSGLYILEMIEGGLVSDELVGERSGYQIVGEYTRDPKNYPEVDAKVDLTNPDVHKVLKEINAVKIENSLARFQSPNGSKIGLHEFSSIIAKESRYSHMDPRNPIPSASVEELRYPNQRPSDDLIHALRDYSFGGRLFVECNGGNKLDKELLKLDFANQPEIQIENQHTFIRDPDTLVVTADHSHLQTMAYADHGAKRSRLDATPWQDESVNDLLVLARPKGAHHAQFEVYRRLLELGSNDPRVAQMVFTDLQGDSIDRRRIATRVCFLLDSKFHPDLRKILFDHLKNGKPYVDDSWDILHSLSRLGRFSDAQVRYLFNRESLQDNGFGEAAALANNEENLKRSIHLLRARFKPSQIVYENDINIHGRVEVRSRGNPDIRLLAGMAQRKDGFKWEWVHDFVEKGSQSHDHETVLNSMRIALVSGPEGFQRALQYFQTASQEDISQLSYELTGQAESHPEMNASFLKVFEDVFLKRKDLSEGTRQGLLGYVYNVVGSQAFQFYKEAALEEKDSLIKRFAMSCVERSVKDHPELAHSSAAAFESIYLHDDRAEIRSDVLDGLLELQICSSDFIQHLWAEVSATPNSSSGLADYLYWLQRYSPQLPTSEMMREADKVMNKSDDAGAVAKRDALALIRRFGNPTPAEFEWVRKEASSDPSNGVRMEAMQTLYVLWHVNPDGIEKDLRHSAGWDRNSSLRQFASFLVSRIEDLKDSDRERMKGPGIAAEPGDTLFSILQSALVTRRGKSLDELNDDLKMRGDKIEYESPPIPSGLTPEEHKARMTQFEEARDRFLANRFVKQVLGIPDREQKEKSRMKDQDWEQLRKRKLRFDLRAPTIQAMILGEVLSRYAETGDFVGLKERLEHLYGGLRMANGNSREEVLNGFNDSLDLRKLLTRISEFERKNMLTIQSALRGRKLARFFAYENDALVRATQNYFIALATINWAPVRKARKVSLPVVQENAVENSSVDCIHKMEVVGAN